MKTFIITIIILFTALPSISQKPDNSKIINYKGGKAKDSICNLRYRMEELHSDLNALVTSFTDNIDSNALKSMTAKLDSLYQQALHININSWWNPKMYNGRRLCLEAIYEVKVAFDNYSQQPSFTVNTLTICATSIFASFDAIKDSIFKIPISEKKLNSEWTCRKNLKNLVISCNQV